jgi:hypothetical protein
MFIGGETFCLEFGRPWRAAFAIFLPALAAAMPKGNAARRLDPELSGDGNLYRGFTRGPSGR